MAFTLTGTRQPREAGEGLTPWSHISEVIEKQKKDANIHH